jgi:cytochrome c553
MVAVLFAALAFCFAAADPPPAGDAIVLDRNGRQDPVVFRHGEHIKVAPDPQRKSSSNCAGCHHTKDERGVIQLTRCGDCHGPEGDPRNPRGATLNEENRKTAFHEMCIGCHADLARSAPAERSGPVDCADCHKSASRGRG